MVLHSGYRACKHLETATFMQQLYHSRNASSANNLTTLVIISLKEHFKIHTTTTIVYYY